MKKETHILTVVESSCFAPVNLKRLRADDELLNFAATRYFDTVLEEAVVDWDEPVAEYLVRTVVYLERRDPK